VTPFSHLLVDVHNFSANQKRHVKIITILLRTFPLTKQLSGKTEKNNCTLARNLLSEIGLAQRS